MGLGNAVFAGWIAWLALFGDNISLAGDAALKLGLNVAATSLLERIGASAGDQHAADRE
jgi:Na+/H+ antiporter NhaC